MSVWNWLKGNTQTITEPAPAYDAWAAGYDQQPGNLMLDLDEELNNDFLGQTTIRNKVVADVGCGTGRHWKKLYSHSPARLVGYDVSEGMLHMLKNKFPQAETVFLDGNRLIGMERNSCDLIISTLAVAHIPDIGNAFHFWNEALKPGGEIFITDYHPEALSRGGQRTFKHDGRTVSVRNHIHSIDKLRSLCGQLFWKEISFRERRIDEKVRDYYARQNALPVYEKFNGSRIIYSIHLKKENGTP